MRGRNGCTNWWNYYKLKAFDTWRHMLGVQLEGEHTYDDTHT